ncbi:hypothetical protein P43SY_000666 [Pythium insidiosum]|uniref:CDAN1-interacting nuclease 1 n=1 Tax=Pythium insidiosum TaxID=114742 RepID=A0AAD5M4K9_PYTIN|nr:hypothetical protein P43SY_000666 [Pythium insidiosum]
MHAALSVRASLRRRLAPPSRWPLQAPSTLLAPQPWRHQALLALSTAPTPTPKPTPKPQLMAAKALAVRLRRKPTKKKGPAGKSKPAAKAASKELSPQQRDEERALLAAASQSPRASADDTAVADAPPTDPETVPKEKKRKGHEKHAAEPSDAAAVAVVKKQPKALKDVEADKITLTLQQIESLQKTLPSVDEIAALVSKLRRESFAKGQTLFDLYRIFGNPFLDEQFLTPGVKACCEAKRPGEGIRIVRDMLNQGRKVEEATLRALFEVCDETSAAVEVIELWELMARAGVTLQLKDLNRFLDICHRKQYLDGAIRVLRELRLHRAISVHTYMHWLNQAMLVWRSDAFFELLMEMRLSGVEPEIASLTSLESGRQDRALTVMEGVRAVGLDPCFAMSAVFASMQFSVYKNGPAAEAITAAAVSDARAKFGELRPVEIDWPVAPIPQVLETQAAGLILQQETFRRLKLHQVHRIDELLQMLPITTNMTINLRKQLMRMSLMLNSHRVKRNAQQIAAEYDGGSSLIELSNVHNYPPVSLMRIILLARGMSAAGVKRALAKPSMLLSKRDQQELRKATNYDSMHRSDPFIGSAMYDADSLETTVAHFLRSKGLRVKTEDELGQEQHAKYGRRVLSPDLLILDPLVINGTPIRWIDAKNYYGAHIVSKRLIAKQLESYVKEWGPGAIVFGMGFSDMFSVPGVICLDTTPFPKTRKETVKMRAKSLFYSLANALSFRKDLGSELTQEYPMPVPRAELRAPRGETPEEQEDADDGASREHDGRQEKQAGAPEPATTTTEEATPKTDKRQHKKRPVAGDV